MSSFKIFGRRRRYKVKGLPGIFREVANEIEKKGNPSTEYCCEEVERALGLLEDKIKITIKHADIRHGF